QGDAGDLVACGPPARPPTSRRRLFSFEMPRASHALLSRTRDQRPRITRAHVIRTPGTRTCCSRVALSRAAERRGGLAYLGCQHNPCKNSGSRGPELRPFLSQRMCEMSNLETYREKARECVRAADEVHNSGERVELLGLASVYMALADYVDHGQRG